jgi:sugar phosphate permease
MEKSLHLTDKHYLMLLTTFFFSYADVFTVFSWYKRSELGSRVAVIFSAATIAGAFSVYITLRYGKLTDPSKQRQSGGFLAVAIHNMDGIGGRPEWAWIFILEGLFTILVACTSPWIIRDCPWSANFFVRGRTYVHNYNMS